MGRRATICTRTIITRNASVGLSPARSVFGARRLSALAPVGDHGQARFNANRFRGPSRMWSSDGSPWWSIREPPEHSCHSVRLPNALMAYHLRFNGVQSPPSHLSQWRVPRLAHERPPGRCADKRPSAQVVSGGARRAALAAARAAAGATEDCRMHARADVGGSPRREGVVLTRTGYYSGDIVP